MTNPRLLDTDGNAYSPELDWANVKDEPVVITEYVTVSRKEFDALKAELAALRKSGKRKGSDGD